MIPQAFFFQGDVLLLPADFPDSRLEMGVPLELSKDFENPDIFTMPAIDALPIPEIHIAAIMQGVALPKNWRSVPVRQILAMSSAADGIPAARILRACHIAQWRGESRYCGRCGAENSDAPDYTHRRCPKCEKAEFPKICPAVIVVITDDDNRMLLAHNKRFKAGVYSHISGFNEAGETLEETVVREVREEVNIEVRDIEYVKSQPWPFPNSLMVGYKARYSSGELRPDGVEIEDAQWFTKDNLPELPGEGSLSRFLINRWLNNAL
jgi:NAD+ diphosphatase